MALKGLPLVEPAPKTRADSEWTAVVLLTAGLTLIRLITLFRTPLELYPDEAQYWLWSRTLAFGYYSKPPVIAWSIWASTALGGDAEAWIRLPAALFQAGATLVVFAVARRLYGAATALAAAVLYALMPAVQLSSAVIATDAPLLFFLALTLLAYVSLEGAQGRRRLAVAAGLGAALGLAFLSKYAAVYAVIGLGLHAAISADGRRRWSPATLAVAAAVFAVVLAPNLAWNAAHGFQTLHHTAANAAWGGRRLFNIAELGQFLATQFAVFGPVPFAVLLVGAVMLARRRSLTPADVLLLCFIVPPLLIVSAQAFISRANANWSGASYLPGAILVAGWLTRWRARRLLATAVAIQVGIAITFLVFVISPRAADVMGASNSFKRARGWSESTRLILQRAQAERAQGLSAIAVNNRFLYYAMAYYGRDTFRDPMFPPLRAWLLTEEPENQSETSAPLTQANGQRVLGVVLEGAYLDRMMADFRQVSGQEIDHVGLDRKHDRRLAMFIGEGFSPRPRDVRPGRPIPP
jgi:4-amino-4-deoxy-L-arabinose transferase-like glycosyltransferase